MSTVPPPAEPSAEPTSPVADTPPPAKATPPAARPSLAWLPWLLIRPVHAVRSSDHEGWLVSWAVHLAGLLLLAIVSVILPLLPGPFNSYRGMGFFFISFGSPATWMLEAAWGDLQTLILFATALGLALLATHIGSALAATGLMSWTARGDEPVRKSWGRALRRLWRLTPFAAVLLAVFNVGFSLIEWLFMDLGWQRWEVEPFLYATAWLIAVAWPLTVLLLALHPGHDWPRCRWPAACEGCGYTLMGLEREQSCPECGVPMSLSVDATQRPGPPSIHAHRMTSFLKNWALCITSAILMPTRLGRSLHLLAPGGQHRVLLTMHLAMAVLTAFPGVLAFMLIISLMFGEPWPWADMLWPLVYVSLFLGTWTLATMAVVSLGSAGLVGGLASWKHSRNLLPAACQASCYLSGYNLLWSIANWSYALLMTLVFYLVFEVYGHHPGSLGLLDPFWLVWLGFLALNGLMLAAQLTLLWRITRATRHANW